MEELNPLDYLIDQNGVDWKSHLGPWEEKLPSSFTIWIVNRFGDLFMEFEDGSIHHLDIQLGTVIKRGDSKKDFLEHLLEDQNAADWLYMDYVDQAEKTGLILPSGHCYAFKLPPVISGEYQLENLCTAEIGKHFHFMADLHQQIKDLPDGATITLSTPEEE